MIAFKYQAKRHWEKYLPGMVQALKEEGTYEEELDRAAEQASEELARLVEGGAQVDAAKEVVMKEYILLPPGNYRITDGTLTAPKSIDARFNCQPWRDPNLKDLEASGRPVTAKDKNILAQYSGWGGMAEAFSYDPAPAWRERAALIRANSTRTNLPAPLNPPLPPTTRPSLSLHSCGSWPNAWGSRAAWSSNPPWAPMELFFGTLPEDLAQSTALQGIEKDPVSARIAARLYEKARSKTNPSRTPTNRITAPT